MFKRDTDLSLEQACVLSEYLGLNDEETDFFLLLIQYARAGSHVLKKRLEKQIRQRKECFQQVKHRLAYDKELSDQEKAILLVVGVASWLFQRSNDDYG